MPQVAVYKVSIQTLLATSIPAYCCKSLVCGIGSNPIYKPFLPTCPEAKIAYTL